MTFRIPKTQEFQCLINKILEPLRFVTQKTVNSVVGPQGMSQQYRRNHRFLCQVSQIQFKFEKAFEMLKDKFDLLKSLQQKTSAIIRMDN